MAKPRLTAPQIELLTDIAKNPVMYVGTYSRWARTGGCLVRHGLATMCGLEGNQSEVKITPDGVQEATRRGLIPAAGGPVNPND
jgi:hypothetical protein